MERKKQERMSLESFFLINNRSPDRSFSDLVSRKSQEQENNSIAEIQQKEQVACEQGSAVSGAQQYLESVGANEISYEDFLKNLAQAEFKSDLSTAADCDQKTLRKQAPDQRHAPDSILSHISTSTCVEKNRKSIAGFFQIKGLKDSKHSPSPSGSPHASADGMCLIDSCAGKKCKSKKVKGDRKMAKTARKNVNDITGMPETKTAEAVQDSSDLSGRGEEECVRDCEEQREPSNSIVSLPAEQSSCMSGASTKRFTNKRDVTCRSSSSKVDRVEVNKPRRSLRATKKSNSASEDMLVVAAKRESCTVLCEDVGSSRSQVSSNGDVLLTDPIIDCESTRAKRPPKIIGDSVSKKRKVKCDSEGLVADQALTLSNESLDNGKIGYESTEHSNVTSDAQDDNDIIFVQKVDSPAKQTSPLKRPLADTQDETKKRPFSMASDNWLNLRYRQEPAVLSQAELFPKIPHVTQLDCNQSPMHTFPELKINSAESSVITPLWRSLGSHTPRTHPCCRRHCEPSDTTRQLTKVEVKAELKILSKHYPSYPWQRVYKNLRARAGRPVMRDTDDTARSSDAPDFTGNDSAESSVGELWTEKYRPSCSAELHGYGEQVETIHLWLMEWVCRMVGSQVEAEQNSRHRVSVCSDDTDFEGAHRSTLSPVLLLTGPHGVGKTTCVYSIAKELGFKVFEMNTSMVRSSKTIMEQLKETTLSHQVHRVGKGVGIDEVFSKLENDGKESKEKVTTPTIASFFSKMKVKPSEVKQAADADTPVRSVKKSERPAVDTAAVHLKRSGSVQSNKTRPALPQLEPQSLCAGREQNVEDSSSKEHLTLCRRSLILFDEADIVFDEDVGFWQAIKALSVDARKPIIMTARSLAFVAPLGLDCLTVEFPRCSYEPLACYLCEISLVENAVPEFSAMVDLVEQYAGDLRRCLLQLQLLVTSREDPSRSHLERRNASRSVTHSDMTDSSLPSERLRALAKCARLCCHLDVISKRPLESIQNERVLVQAGVSDTLMADTCYCKPNDSLIAAVESLSGELLAQLAQSHTAIVKAKSRPSLEYRAQLRGVGEQLPMCSISRQVLPTDFYPILQDMCAAELERKHSKGQRRFFHYLDQANIFISEEYKMQMAKPSIALNQYNKGQDIT